MLTRKMSYHRHTGNLLGGSLIALIIITSPIIFYSYKYGLFPNKKIWETPYFTMTSHYYESVSTFFWVFLSKLVSLYLLLIWFFTCRYWWYWSILIPIIMYSYQILALFNDEFQLKDEPFDLIYIIPFILFIASLLLFIRKKISKFIGQFNLKEQIENDIEEVLRETEKETFN